MAQEKEFSAQLHKLNKSYWYVTMAMGFLSCQNRPSRNLNLNEFHSSLRIV